MQRPKAVLFDLYDTLTYADRQRYEEKVNVCAKICNIPRERFLAAWKSLVAESNLGKFPTTEDRVRAVMRILGIPERQASINAVVACEHEFLKSGVFLHHDAVSTLVLLQKDGLKLGIVTNASPSVRIVLNNHRIHEYVDCVIISSEVGYRKPDTRIYKIALQKLRVKAQDCLLVGDGNDRELDGAHRLGIVTVWIKRDAPKVVQVEESSIANVDFVVRSLAEVTNIIEK